MVHLRAKKKGAEKIIEIEYVKKQKKTIREAESQRGWRKRLLPIHADVQDAPGITGNSFLVTVLTSFSLCL